MASPGRASPAPLSLVALAVCCAALLAIPASAGRLGVSQATSFLPRRSLLQGNGNINNAGGSCSLNCTQLAKCITAQCLYTVGSDSYVQVDLSRCKDASVSWFCCQRNTCTTTSCDGLAVNNATCNTVFNAVVTTVVGATSVTLQVHDGQLVGNANCTRNGCCGGGGGNCGGDNTCDSVVVNIDNVNTCNNPWGFPQSSQYAKNANLSAAELALDVSDPGFANKVFWNARQYGGAWGGWFRILPPTISTTATLNLGICAGCGQNVVDKGYYFGDGFSITFTNASTFNSSMSTLKVKPLSNAVASIVNMQVFLAFMAPPDLNPGGFKTFTDYGPPVTPTNPLTDFTNANFFANAKPGAPYRVAGNTTIQIAASQLNSTMGLYLAVHFDVASYCRNDYQWQGQVIY
ncbi:hypothetical protein HYH02_010353 [Chlamydomonas schloesseri]|uniref:Uncharacterized protein n=1 Tax=Chlamydomonas schloesseri TaxID=2026947 RepID=A0A835W7Q2_9CHLO|nr:hypothetical protein HYH02_010353 [Chlamydomonas schloesseri]|eukprot:KAG2440473.1 hypothetical protein HYH02_010353 [Chlamydomonas schloesseri]